MVTDEIIMYLAVNAFDVEIIRRSMRIFFDRPNKRAACIFAYILYYTSLLFTHSIGNTLVSVVVSAVTIGYIASVYEGKIKIKIIAAAFTFSLMCLCEFAVGTIFVDEYNGLLLNSETPDLFALTISRILNFSVIIIISRTKKRKNIIPNAGVDWSAVALIPISTAVLEIVVISLTQSTAAVVLTSIIILFLNVIVFYLYDKLAENYDNKLKLAMVEREKEAYYNQCVSVIKSQEALRQFKHDINNQLEVIAVLADKGNSGELKEQIRDLISGAYAENFNCFTGNTVVDGILNYKLSKLKQSGAEVETDLMIPVQKFMNTKDLTVILGNLLDNAIDALSVQQEKGYCFVQIKYAKGCLIIHIRNTNQNPVIYKNGSIESSKTDRESHGIGLKSVKDIVEKYNGQMETAHDDRFFSVKVILLLLPEDSDE